MNRFMYLWLVCVLSVAAAASAAPMYHLTTLATFNGANGDSPAAGLLADASGNLYGTTYYGGGGSGSVFKVAAGNHVLSTVASFNFDSNGAYPRCGLIADASGNLYDTTSSGGANGRGTVFKVAAGTNALSTLVAFNGANGANPAAGLIADNSGNLYGTTLYGGNLSLNNGFGVGTVFKLAAGTHSLSTLATFDGTNGAYPVAGLTADASGDLYGTTQNGGANNRGTVFEVANDVAHTLTTLGTFTGANGQYPMAGLIVGASGNLYGTTFGGGANGVGTVFELAAGSHTITTLAAFNGTHDGPEAELFADASGNLYGTTTAGGASSKGTVFEVAAGTHELTTLFTFDGTNGADPISGLIADASGNLYGTTSKGGANGRGTVFRLSPVPEPSTLAFVAIGVLGFAGRARAFRLGCQGKCRLELITRWKLMNTINRCILLILAVLNAGSSVSATQYALTTLASLNGTNVLSRSRPIRRRQRQSLRYDVLRRGEQRLGHRTRTSHSPLHLKSFWIP